MNNDDRIRLALDQVRAVLKSMRENDKEESLPVSFGLLRAAEHILDDAVEYDLE